MFELNVFSNISLSRIAVKYFLEQDKAGHIVLTSSIAGLIPAPFSPTYSATKFALHVSISISNYLRPSNMFQRMSIYFQGYYGSLYMEKLRNKIKVTVLCPGPVRSNLLPACFTGKSGEVEFIVDLKPSHYS